MQLESNLMNSHRSGPHQSSWNWRLASPMHSLLCQLL